MTKMLQEYLRQYKVPTIIGVSLLPILVSIWRYQDFSSNIFYFLLQSYSPLEKMLPQIFLTILFVLLSFLFFHIFVYIKSPKFNICPNCKERTFEPKGYEIKQLSEGELPINAGIETVFQCSNCGYLRKEVI